MSVEEEKRNAERAERARKAGLPEWQQETADQVPTSLIQDLVADSRRSSRPSSMMEEKQKPIEKKGSGWNEAIPLKPQPGISVIDAMCEEQSRKDKAELVRAINKSASEKGKE
jgi:hypothetical protein